MLTEMEAQVYNHSRRKRLRKRLPIPINTEKTEEKEF